MLRRPSFAAPGKQLGEYSDDEWRDLAASSMKGTRQASFTFLSRMSSEKAPLMKDDAQKRRVDLNGAVVLDEA
jgi:hypothetical protein